MPDCGALAANVLALYRVRGALYSVDHFSLALEAFFAAGSRRKLLLGCRPEFHGEVVVGALPDAEDESLCEQIQLRRVVEIDLAVLFLARVQRCDGGLNLRGRKQELDFFAAGIGRM